MRKRNWKRWSAMGLALSMLLSSAAPSVQAQASETVPPAAVNVEEPAGAAATFATEGTRAMTGVHYLSDMTMIDSACGWEDWAMDEDIDNGGIISLTMEDGNTKAFEKGLAANAGKNYGSYAVYDVSGFNGSTFFAYAGVHVGQAGKEGATCRFRVQIDSKTVWESDGIRTPNDAAQMIVEEIPEGARELKLYIDGGTDGINYDHGCYAKACILDDQSLLKTPESVSTKLQGYLDVGDSAELSVSGSSFDELPLTIDDTVTVSCKSSDENVLSVTGSGAAWTVTGEGDGTATISTTLEKDGVTLTSSNEVLVGEGEEGSMLLSSPNNVHKLLFSLSEDGALTYNVLTDVNGKKNTVANGCETGLETNLGDFSTGLKLVDMTEETVTDSYDLLGAKKSHVDATGRQLTMKFEKTPNENGVYFYVIARAYDDGVAFRYQISSEENLALDITREDTTLVVPGSAVNWATPFNNHNESQEVRKPTNGLSGAFCMPHLYQVGDTYCLLSEAAISQEYAGAALYGNGTGRLEIRVSEGDNRPTKVVKTSTSVIDPWGGEAHPWVSPWRFLVMGDLDAIHCNTMAETLSPDCVLEDTSWIDPGACSWTWLNGAGTSSLETYKRYVDMTAAMGWKYLLMDEGWQPSSGVSSSIRKYKGLYDWFPELAEYAKEKGVGLVAWFYYTDLDTPEEREFLTELSEKYDVKGIKPDFFDSNSQEFMKYYMELYQKTAECHMFMNAHGAPKTTGERRTFPHLLVREGIYGAEMGGGPSAFHTCCSPFTRNAVGPADYTPLLRNQSNYSMGHNAALPITMEAGVTCMAETDTVYLNTVIRPLLQDIPCGWKDSAVLEGDVGTYATIMRESMDGRYYIGTICDAPRTTSISLDFLPEGTYHAYIAEDNASRTDVTLRHCEVSSADVLELPLQNKGGALIMIQATELTRPESLTLSSHELELKTGDVVSLPVTIVPEKPQIADLKWTSSNESVVAVENGQLTAKGVGLATVTVSSGDVSDSCFVKVYPGDSLVVAGDWSIQNPSKDHYVLEDENTLTLKTTSGMLLREKNTAKNEFFFDADKDFEASVELTFSPTANYQSAGLLAMGDNGAYTSVWRRYHTYFGNNLLNHVTWNLTANDVSEKGQKRETAAEVQGDKKTVWLKMKKEGDMVTSYYSYDGAAWSELYTEANPTLNEAKSIRVGIYMGDDNSGTGTLTGTFRNFTYKAKDGEEKLLPFSVMPKETALGMVIAETGKDMYHGDEAFDKSGYTFTMYNADGTETAVSGADCEITGFTPGKGGKQMVTFSYEGLTCEVEVTVLVEDDRVLLDAVSKAYESLDLSAFTEESAAALQNALKEAELVLEGTSDKTAEEAMAALMAAAAGLTLDTSSLAGDVAEAQATADAAAKAAAAAKAVADAAAKKGDLETMSQAVMAANQASAEAQRLAQEAADKGNAAAIKLLESALQTASDAAGTAKSVAEAASALAEEAKSDSADAEAKALAAQTTAENAKKAAADAQTMVNTLTTQLKEAAEQKELDQESIRKLEEETKAANAATEAAKKAAEEARAQAKALQNKIEKLQFSNSEITLKTLKALKKKQMRAVWTAVEGAEGYEVRYCTNAKFKKAKKVTVKSGATLKATIKKLKKGKRYYVKVRAFKTFDGVKTYTGYTNVKKAKAK